MQMINLFYDDFMDAIKRKVPFLIPIGTMEYHAHHASCGCDTMVINGILEKLGKKKEIVVCPPIWYGVSSYAVSGPEKGTIHVDSDTYESYIYSILKSMIYGGNKNVYCIFFHQSEGDGLMPMSLACMKAAKKLLMEYLEEKAGLGWWGHDSMSSYYNNLDTSENPLNFIKVIQLIDRETQEKLGGLDHAGKYETSLLAALYPENVDFDRIKNNDEWFALNADEASIELGQIMVDCSLEYLDRVIV